MRVIVGRILGVSERLITTLFVFAHGMTIPFKKQEEEDLVQRASGGYNRSREMLFGQVICLD